MKKFLTLLLLVIFSFTIVSCVNEKTPEPPTPPSPPVYDGVGFTIHYSRPDGDYANWGLWLWEIGKDGKLVEFEGVDDYGAFVSFEFSEYSPNLEAGQLGIIVRQKGEWIKDVEADRFIMFKNFKKDNKGYYHIYVQSGDAELYTTADGEQADKIQIFTFSYNKVLNQINLMFRLNHEYESYQIKKDNEVILSSENDSTNENVVSKTTKSIEYTFGSELPNITSTYKLIVKFKQSQKEASKVADISALYSTEAFNNQYAYEGQLGAIYSKESTTFRVWSPISNSIKLRIYNTGTPASLPNGTDNYEYEYIMTQGVKGTWEYTLQGDLEGKYYTYVVSNSTYTNVEIVDPYAKSTGVNGLRGMIVDFSKTNPTGWDNINIHNYKSTELTVYETHIADLTSSTTWGGTPENAKLFKGFYETGTKYQNVTTGFDHIKELGVNAVQLLPIFDQANNELQSVFNWGYNPLNYNSLEGIYSSNPYDGYQKIKEFKELVMAYNEAGINIIMDVVYNHVNAHEKSNFDILMPKYYFRYNSSGASNGSGCGNETASENYMFRKFMIDSTQFWASEYKLGGFRFDLMALHDIETMNLLSANLHDNVNENITVYGEPWTGGTSTLPSNLAATQANMNKYEGYGCFNDQMRDALIKSGMCGKTERGWITDTSTVKTADMDKIVIGIKGKVLSSIPTYDSNKTVNYVTCHDNYTLYDRIKEAGITDEATIKKMAMLSNSIVFTSQGISFMLAGEEFLRTKGGDENSYQSSYKVNELDYALKVKNYDMFKNYQKLIELKKNNVLFGLTGDEAKNIEIKFNSNKSLIWYDLVDTTNNVTYRIIHSNGVSATDKIIDLSGYELYLDTLNSNVEFTISTVISDYQTIIAKKTLN